MPLQSANSLEGAFGHSGNDAGGRRKNLLTRAVLLGPSPG